MGSSSWSLEYSNRTTMAMILLPLMTILSVMEGGYSFNFYSFQPRQSIYGHTHTRGFPRVQPTFKKLQSVPVQYYNFQQPTTRPPTSYSSGKYSALSQLSSGNIVEQTRAQAESAKTILKSLKNNQKAASSTKKALKTSGCLNSLEDAIEAIEGSAKLVEDNGPEILYLVATVDSLENEKDLTKLIKSSAKLLRIMEDLIPNLAEGPSKVCNVSPAQRVEAFKDLAKLFEDISNTYNFQLPYKTREALQLSSKIMSEVGSFLGKLNKSLAPLDTLCSEDKNAVYDTIGDILENMAALFETLGGAQKAREIRKQGVFVKQIVDAFENLDIDSNPDCGSFGSYTALAKTLDNLAGIVEEVGIEKLSKELGINLNFINL